MRDLVASTPAAQRIAHRARAAALALGLCGAIALTVAPAGAQAGRLEIRAPRTAAETGKVRYATTVIGAAERVAFAVDGRTRWVDRSSRRSFRRGGYLRTAGLGVGRHRLVVSVKRRDGRLVRTGRVLYVGTKSRGRGKKLEPAPEPAPEPESTSEPAPSEPAPSEPAPEGETTPSPPVGLALLDAGFENGLLNWNTGGVGDVVPTAVTDVVRSGSSSGRVVLGGSQGRSELILGGSGTSSTTDTVRFREGDEYWYAFSLNVRSMVYGRPGAHNLIMQFKSDGEGSPNFGLQLWDYEGRRGLWSHGEAMGGDRFLAPFAERTWHDVVIHFRASNKNAGFYELFLDGQRLEGRSGVSMIRPDRSYAYVKNGLYRNGGQIPGTSELRLDAARLGLSLTAVLAG